MKEHYGRSRSIFLIYRAQKSLQAIRQTDGHLSAPSWLLDLVSRRFDELVRWGVRYHEDQAERIRADLECPARN
jgi:hypothetical protein